MRKVILLGAMLVSMNGFSQEEQMQPELNCYNKWAAKFEDRGAEEVKDGVYDDIIVTIRQGAKAVCYNGKAEVRGGMVTKVYTLLTDGTYEEVKRTWKNNSDKNVNVINGISKSMISIHGELINVLWYKKIKPKKAKPSLAPEPVDD